MSPLLIAVLALATPPAEGISAGSPPADAAVAEMPRAEPRAGQELRIAVRAALRRWARPSDAQADGAAREFISLYRELQGDRDLARSQREYYRGKVRIRLMQLSDQIARRVARAKRLAEAEKPKRIELPEGKADALAQRPGAAGRIPAGFGPAFGPGRPAFGGGAGQVPDYGEQLVELIQTVIRPETWDVNGGPGTIYYWYPGRALVVRQMQEVHEDLGGALEQLRRAGR